MRRTALLLLAAAAFAACRSPIERERSCDPEPAWVEVTGTRETSPKELRAAARSELVSLAKGGHTESDAEDAAWAMEDYLRRAGFPRAHVDFQVDGCRVVFRVREGLHAELGCVCFEKRRGIELREACGLYAFPGRGPLGIGRPYWREDQLDDADRDLEWLYVDRGWYRAKVGPRRTTWCVRGGMLVGDVTVPVDEGKRYFVVDLRATNMELTDADRLAYVGRPFSPRMPGRLAGCLRRRLLDRGYAFAEVRSDIEVDDERAAVRILMHADPGPLIRVGNVCIVGTERTKPSFVRGQIRQWPGTLYHGGRMREDVSALYASGVFASVSPEVVKAGPCCGDVVVTVREAKSRAIEVFGGYGSYEKLRGGVRFTDDNIFGIARRLAIEARASLKGYASDVTVEDPWTFGRKNVASARVGFEHRQEPFYLIDRFLVETAIEHRFDERLRLRVGYQFAVDHVGDVAADIPADELDDALDLETRVGAVFAKGTYDTRDSAFLPTRGVLLSVGGKWSAAFLGANPEIAEASVKAATFRTLGRMAVLGVGVSFDTRWPLGGRDTLPIQYRYFLGGASDVRAFGEDELTPTDANGEGLGGLTAAWGSIELRRHVVGALHVAAFYDVGVVSPDPMSLDGAFGYGVGAGVRYYLPVGPLRVDVAYNPGELHAADSRWQIHASFGFSF